ncbi:hypothetical protein SBV1_1260034 [Verrucomicrobia bacterium]|nr:hypothetical protein SBV1_1260034 [Verrucomicrobiota bacterium]
MAWLCPGHHRLDAARGPEVLVRTGYRDKGIPDTRAAPGLLRPILRQTGARLRAALASLGREPQTSPRKLNLPAQP